VNLGTIIRLAHRLGMEWSKLDPSTGNMTAEGNGHSIYGSVIPGLGISLQYSYNCVLDPHHSSPSQGGSPKDRTEIPTHAADKLRCGILPPSELLFGDAGLDYQLIGRERDHCSIGTALRQLGVPAAARAKLIERTELERLRHGTLGTGHVLNDMVCLVCPFMPLVDDFRNDVVWPILTASLHSPLIFWEGRQVLVEQLRSSTKSHATEYHKLALEKLSVLERKYHCNFHAVWSEAITDQDRDGLRSFIAELRTIHDGTTEKIRNACNQPKGQTVYRALLSAHLTMATEAAWWACTRSMEKGPKNGSNTQETRARDAEAARCVSHSASRIQIECRTGTLPRNVLS
jgi:hypothetical protein